LLLRKILRAGRGISFEDIQRYFAYSKVIIAELASLIGLTFLLYQGLKLEMKW
jgi:hypothetical protein